MGLVAEPDAANTDAIGQDTAAIPACPPLRFAPRAPLTDMGWEILPEGIELALRKATDHLPGVPIWICENGAAVVEHTDAAGIHDPIRVEYLDDHVRALLRARDKGFDVRGYFAWSLMDNLEWSLGFSKTFGMVHVDRQTLVRTIKDSGLWYRAMIKANRR